MPDRYQRPPASIVGTLLRRHRNGERAAMQALLLGWLGIVSHPLYFVMFMWVFPQPYECPLLRVLGTAIGAAGLVAARYGERWSERYVPAALTCLLPFFGT